MENNKKREHVAELIRITELRDSIYRGDLKAFFPEGVYDFLSLEARNSIHMTVYKEFNEKISNLISLSGILENLDEKII